MFGVSANPLHQRPTRKRRQPNKFVDDGCAFLAFCARRYSNPIIAIPHETLRQLLFEMLETQSILGNRLEILAGVISIHNT